MAVRVTDHGPGIEKTELKRIFKRFYRVPGALATRVKGTGLGLYIVRSVAKRHGGRAWAESEGPGTGRTFVLQLPDREMSRILVVEDEQHLAEGLRFNLEAEGYQVQGGGDGRGRAGDHCGSNRRAFDVVILDVMLPGKDGFTVMSEMRGRRAVRSHADADRARPSGRRAEGLRRGRRRLPDQALRAGHPDRAHSADCCGGGNGCAHRLDRVGDRAADRVAQPPNPAPRTRSSRSATSPWISTGWSCACASRCFR